MRDVARLAFVCVVASFTASCRAPEPPAPFQVVVKIESDPGKPVVGASILAATKVLATTNQQGRATLALPGVEGEVIDVTIKCPDTFQSPSKPTSIRLTRVSDKTKVPEYAVSCPPSVRKVVVAVRAENGPNLPVVVLNRIVARTDLSGAAHFALNVAPGAQFSVLLDTSERGNERLKPPNPSKPFTAGAQDDIVVFDQKFDVERKPVAAPPPRIIPKSLNRP